MREICNVVGMYGRTITLAAKLRRGREGRSASDLAAVVILGVLGFVSVVILGVGGLF